MTGSRDLLPPVVSTAYHDKALVAQQDTRITDELARKVLGWRLAPARFFTSGRSWIPRWRFEPMSRLEDAFLLLDRAGAEYRLGAARNQVFTAEVRVGRSKGKAFGEERARVITMALVRALGLDRESDATTVVARVRSGTGI